MVKDTQVVSPAPVEKRYAAKKPIRAVFRIRGFRLFVRHGTSVTSGVNCECSTWTVQRVAFGLNIIACLTMSTGTVVVH